jgi:hypothetical protein
MISASLEKRNEWMTKEWGVLTFLSFVSASGHCYHQTFPFSHLAVSSNSSNGLVLFDCRLRESDESPYGWDQWALTGHDEMIKRMIKRSMCKGDEGKKNFFL